MSDVRSDAELITAAREGDQQAYGELYRRHSASALRFARSLAGRNVDPEDLVADAFARVLAALTSGDGPTEAFRPYLLSAVRNAFYDQARRAAREQPVAELSPLAPDVPFVDPVMFKDESRLVATAFGELPERWQVVLWHTEVEGEKAAEVAPMLGISPNAVSALAYRAREGLRERYLQAHVNGVTDEQCRQTVGRLAAYTRRNLSRGQAAKVRAHLKRCDRCRLLVGELADLNSRLGALLGPVVLGGAAAVHLATGGAASTGAGVAGVGALLRRLIFRPEAKLAAGAVATAGVVTVMLPFVQPAPSPGAAEPIVTATRTPPPATSPPPSATPTPTPSPASSDSPTTDMPALPADATLATSSAPTGSGLNAGLVVTLEPLGSLVRGLPGLLLLTVTNPTDGATGAVNAVFTLPEGVTLRVTNAGHGWTCSHSEGMVTCTRPELAPGQTSKAHVHLSVALTASDGLPSVLVSGPGSSPVLATATRGVVDSVIDVIFGVIP